MGITTNNLHLLDGTKVFLLINLCFIPQPKILKNCMEEEVLTMVMLPMELYLQLKHFRNKMFPFHVNYC